MVELVPMNRDAFDGFLAWTVRDFADEQVRAGTWDAAEAAERSKAEIQGLLPQGLETPDHFFRSIVHGAPREPVGTLWYALRKVGPKSELFIYWIGIDERFRRRGFATEAFTALDEEARRAGASTISLHVFGHNRSARALYEKLGFDTTHLMMTRNVPAAAKP
jgi:RimJ/RimL family protein N-acetyltransferase